MGAAPVRRIEVGCQRVFAGDAADGRKIVHAADQRVALVVELQAAVAAGQRHAAVHSTASVLLRDRFAVGIEHRAAETRRGQNVVIAAVIHRQRRVVAAQRNSVIDIDVFPGGQRDAGRVSTDANGLIDVDVVGGLQGEPGVAAPIHRIVDIDVVPGGQSDSGRVSVGGNGLIDVDVVGGLHRQSRMVAA